MADIMTSTDLLAIDFSKNKVRTHYFSATKLKENSLLVGVDLSSKVEQVCFKVNDTVYNVQLKPKEFEDFLKDKKISVDVFMANFDEKLKNIFFSLMIFIRC